MKKSVLIGCFGQCSDRPYRGRCRSQVDEAALKDFAHLLCGDGGTGNFLENKWGEPPRACTTS